MKNKFFAGFLSFFLLFSNSFASVENANLLAREGIIVDNSKNVSNYRLYDKILRQETAVVALGMFKGAKKGFCENIFSDVSLQKPNNWACYTIEALAEKNIISKQNKNFRPEDFITKSEVLGMLIKSSFNDEYKLDEANIATKGNWQKQIVDFSVSRGIIKNFSDYDTMATRDFVFDVGANILKYKNGTLKNSDVEVFGANYNISPLKAKEIILKISGLAENQISGLEINTDFKKGESVYKVEFFILGSGIKLFYYISTSTGEILEYDINFR